MIVYFRSADQSQLDFIFSSDFYRHSMVDPLYSESSAEYFSVYHGRNWTDHSAAFLLDGRVCGVVIAFSHQRELSYFEQPIFISLSRDYQINPSELEKVLKEYLAYLRLNKIERVFCRRGSSLTSIGIEQKNIEINICSVNLNVSKAQLRSALRKSYKSLVNWGLKNLEFKILDSTNYSKEAFLKFKDFHRDVAGKSTRPDETWMIQLEMIRSREAFVILGHYLQKLVAGCLVLHNNHSAYYAVGVYDRKLMSQKLPVSHSVVFLAVEHAKEMDLKKFVLGSDFRINSEKEKNIFRFKSGFSNNKEKDFYSWYAI
jgi:hypothetical protein